MYITMGGRMTAVQYKSAERLLEKTQQLSSMTLAKKKQKMSFQNSG